MTSPVIVLCILLLTIKLKNCHRESENTMGMTLDRISERKEANRFRINEGVIHIVVIEM